MAFILRYIPLLNNYLIKRQQRKVQETLKIGIRKLKSLKLRLKIDRKISQDVINAINHRMLTAYNSNYLSSAEIFYEEYKQAQSGVKLSNKRFQTIEDCIYQLEEYKFYHYFGTEVQNIGKRLGDCVGHLGTEIQNDGKKVLNFAEHRLGTIRKKGRDVAKFQQVIQKARSGFDITFEEIDALDVIDEELPGNAITLFEHLKTVSVNLKQSSSIIEDDNISNELDS